MIFVSCGAAAERGLWPPLA